MLSDFYSHNNFVDPYQIGAGFVQYSENVYTDGDSTRDCIVHVHLSESRGAGTVDDLPGLFESEDVFILALSGYEELHS